MLILLKLYNILEFKNLNPYNIATAYKDKKIDNEYIFGLSNLLNRDTYAKLLNLILDKDNPVLINENNNAGEQKKGLLLNIEKRILEKRLIFI